VSPVFAVIPREGLLSRLFGGQREDKDKKPSAFAWLEHLWGLRRARAVTITAAVLLFAGSAVLAVWVMNRPEIIGADKPDAKNREVVLRPTPGDPPKDPALRAGPTAEMPETPGAKSGDSGQPKGTPPTDAGTGR